MRSLPRLRALAVVLPAPSLLVAALLAGLLGAAPAGASTLPGDGPVGGPLLSGTGTVLGPGAPPLPAQAVAHGLVVADLDTGAVLAARDPHGRYAPASTLKILTAVTLSPLLDRSRKLVPTFDDLNVDGTKVGLVERVGYPVDELFTAMMMVSGNDVANTLASAAGGPKAIEAMNAEADRLQARDTHAVNPSGLDAPGQVSSAYDLALLGRAGMADPDFRRWVSTIRSSVSGPGGKRIETYNHDKLLTRYPGALGIKNGYTTTAKASFVGAATRGGHTVLVSMMRTQPKVDVEARALLDWGFAAIAAGAQPVGTLVEPTDGGLAVASAPPAASAVLRLPVAEEPVSGGGLSMPLLTVAGLSALTLLVRRRRRVVLARAAARRAVPQPRPAPPRTARTVLPAAAPSAAPRPAARAAAGRVQPESRRRVPRR